MSKKRNVPLRNVLRMENLISRGVPREYAKATLADFEMDKDLYKLFYNYLTNIELMHDDNVSLILFGMNGNGKTWLSSLIVKEAYIHRYKSMRVTLQSYIDMHFKRDREEIVYKLAKIEEVDFLVIDEVGKEVFSKGQFNIIALEELLRKRETLGLPTIICTNLPLRGNGGLFMQYGKSIESLVNGNYFPVEFVGDDFRREVTQGKRGLHVLLGEED